MIGGDVWRGVGRRIIFLALVVFAAGAPLLPSNDLKVALTLSAALVLAPGYYICLRAGAPIVRSPLDAPAAAFLVAASLATLVSVDPFVSFFPSSLRGDGLLVYVAYIIMALAAARLTRTEVHALVTTILASGGLIGGIAVAQYYGVDVTRWMENEHLSFGRSWGTLGNPIFLGGYASLLLPVGVVLASCAVGRKWWGYATASTALYGALVASQTRAAWVASIGAAILLVRVLPASPQAYRRLLLLGIAFVTVTVVMVLARPQASLVQRAVSTFNMGDLSVQAHLFVWKHTLPLLRQRPVLGWGFSTLLGRLPGIGSPEYLRVFGYRLVAIDTPHNEILHIAYSTGVVGLGAYLWVWATVLRGLETSLQTTPAGAELSAALLASLAALFVWLQLAWSHVGPANAFWALAGGAVALTRSERGQERGSVPERTS